jgi:hypothetical protein
MKEPVSAGDRAAARTVALATNTAMDAGRGRAVAT